MVRPTALVAAVLVLALGAAPAAAMDLRAGTAARVGPDEIVHDDLYAAGPWVVVAGRVRGDVIAASGHVDHAGEVDGHLIAAAGAVSVAGRVGGAVRVVGGNVVLRGPVGGDAVSASGSLVVLETARIARDLVAVAGNITLLGAVGRHARLAAERVEIGGTVGGDLHVAAAQVVLAPTAVVHGTVRYRSNRPIEVAPGARVLGGVERLAVPQPPGPSRSALRALRVGLGIADFLWMLVVALALVAIAPAALQTTANTLRARPWAALGWGLLALAATPVAVAVLFVMVLGIPIGLLLIVTQALALFVGHAAVGLAFGQTAAPRLGSRYAAAALGVAIVAVATHVPYVGWLLRAIVIALGLGAIALALRQRREPAGPAPVP